MKPTTITPCTRVMGRPAGTLEEDCGALQISDVKDPIWGPMMVSAWRPTPEEREAIANGAPVMLSIQGTRHPVVSVYAGKWADENAPELPHTPKQDI